MKAYREERLAVWKNEQKWDYTKPVNPHQCFHIKVDLSTRTGEEVVLFPQAEAPLLRESKKNKPG